MTHATAPDLGPLTWVKGEIDASLDFTTNVPYTIGQMGEEASSFLVYDFGVTTFNDTIVVTEDPTANTRDRIVQKHGYADGSAFDAPGTQRFTLRLTPTKITGR